LSKAVLAGALPTPGSSRFVANVMCNKLLCDTLDECEEPTGWFRWPLAAGGVERE